MLECSPRGLARQQLVFGIERHTAEFMAVDLQHLDATGPDLDQIVTSAVNGLGGDLIGAEHPSTLTSMANLAVTLKGRGQNAEAVKLMEKCIQLRTLVLGADHPDTLSSSATLIVWWIQRLEIDGSATNIPGNNNMD